VEESPGVGLAPARRPTADSSSSRSASNADGRRVRFRSSDATLTVETVARRDTDGSGKIRWWLVEAGAAVKSGQERTQTWTLTLTPLMYDEAGRSGPLDVDAAQPVPGA
jgi:Trypsin-co-occurring domain 2